MHVACFVMLGIFFNIPCLFVYLLDCFLRTFLFVCLFQRVVQFYIVLLIKFFVCVVNVLVYLAWCFLCFLFVCFLFVVVICSFVYLCLCFVALCVLVHWPLCRGCDKCFSRSRKTKKELLVWFFPTKKLL